MAKYLKTAFMALLAVFAIFALWAWSAEAFSVIYKVNLPFFVVGAFFFIFSVSLWVISWAIVLKKRIKLPFSGVFLIGWQAVYGALTPVQVGAEALRSLRLKSVYNTPYSVSISASMLAKGIKFMLITLLAAVFLAAFLIAAKYDIFILAGLLSGFLVVLLASLLFLLPFNQKFSKKIILFFRKISKRIKLFEKLEKYFEHYSEYLRTISLRFFIFISVIVFISWAFEFLSLLFAFYSLQVFIPIEAALLLFVVISVLERTPFLPRGIGLVEFASYIYLSMPAFSGATLNAPEIAAVIIVFDIFRLVIPTVLSMASLLMPVKNLQSNQSKIRE